MQIICQDCKGKFRIPDNKIPENKSVTITCPKCKKKIHVQGKHKENKIDKTDNIKGATGLPFDVLGDEQTALLCFQSSAEGQSIEQDLSTIGYKTVQAKNSTEAIKIARFHPFDVAIVDESFDSKSEESDHILNFFKSLPMSSRRNLFVACVSDSTRTNDHMSAYCQSVNLIVNKKQLPEFKTVFSQAVKENDAFYSVYKETVNKYQ
ncbi:Zinc finger/thioredoxin putative domain protein [Candidatus Magnetomorum sp. HK-1]|nr:Zinc finger/thioredoxin putative domain protein [Candidatus Magnetomorum sp. HK-1]